METYPNIEGPPPLVVVAPIKHRINLDLTVNLILHSMHSDSIIGIRSGLKEEELLISVFLFTYFRLYFPDHR